MPLATLSPRVPVCLFAKGECKIFLPLTRAISALTVTKSESIALGIYTDWSLIPRDPCDPGPCAARVEIAATSESVWNKTERSGWSGECSEGSKGMLKFFGGKTIEETSGLHKCKIIWSSLDY